MLSTPFTLFVVVFGVVPALLLFTYSFWRLSGYTIQHDLTIDNYVRAWTDPTIRRQMLRSVAIGFSATVLIIIVAYPLAYYLAFKARRWRDVLLFLVLLSLFGNYLVRIYAWRSILSTNGLVDTFAVTLGLSSDHRSYLIFTWMGTMVVLTSIYLPFAVLPIYSALLNVPTTVVAAARDLGATPRLAFRRVTLPVSAPGTVAAFAFVFLLTSADFATPLLVGGTGGMMIGVTIQRQFNETLDWPLGSAIAFSYAFVLVVVLLAVFGAVRMAQVWRKERSWG
jgi:spermidine/putrescine transport system permease protein